MKKTVYIFSILILAVFFASCNDDVENIAKKSFTLSLTPVEETFPLGAGATRSEEGVDNIRIENFWMLRFNPDGSYQNSKYYDSYTPGLAMYIKPPKGNDKVLIVANTSDAALFTPATCSSIDVAKKMVMRFSSQKDIVEKNNPLIMSGETTFSSSMSTLDCKLYRSMAKLTLTIDNKEGSTVKIESVKLHNVPSSAVYFKDGRAEVANYLEYDAEDINLMPGSKSKTLRYLMTPNKQDAKPGASSNHEAKNKNKYAPEHATFVQLKGKKSNGKGTAVTYTFYLGENTTNDFNVLANHNYNLNVTIDQVGDAQTDDRIEDEGCIELQGANSYILDPSVIEVYRMNDIQRVMNGYWKNRKDGDYDDNSNKKFNKCLIKAGTKFKPYIIWSDTDDDAIYFCNSSGKPQEWFDDMNFMFKVKDGIKPGNVLIGVVAKANDDKKLYSWSWHLWFTDYSPSASDKIMDRNLGHIDEKHLPLYYQYGRKDPFRTEGFRTKEQGLYPYCLSINEPDCFFKGAGYWYDFLLKYNLNKWNRIDENSKKSFFDPCPKGWKVPSQSDFSEFKEPDYTKDPTEINGIKFPVTSRIYGNNGKFDGVEVWFTRVSRIWMEDNVSSDDVNNAKMFRVPEKESNDINLKFGFFGSPRSDAYPVRCVRMAD